MAFFEDLDQPIARTLANHLPIMRQMVPDELAAIEAEFGSVEDMVRWYIEPNGENTNPADTFDDDTGLIARVPILGMLSDFLGGRNRFTHSLILSDAGMGKTSLLLIVKLAQLDGLTTKDVKVVLIKIGDKLLERLKAVPDPASTILLLDALDEDREAWASFDARLQSILQNTQHFRKTLITCRTQFIPPKHEKDAGKAGVVELYGFTCSKVFLSPFNDKQVKQYLEQRFTDPAVQSKSLAIVGKMKSLKFRPMLLAYVDLLLDRSDEFPTAYDLYTALVDEWFSRELKKSNIKDKDVLLLACSVIAQHLFDEKLPALPPNVLQDLIGKHPTLRFLDDMEVEGRSLLHRMSSGNYKFAHQSLLEFFIAKSLATSPRRIESSDQIKAFLVDLLASNRLTSLTDMDMSKATLQGLKRRGLNATSSNLSGAKLIDSDLCHAVFKTADLSGTSATNCKFTGGNFAGAKLSGAQFELCDLENVKVTDAKLDSMELNDCKLDTIKVSRQLVSKFRLHMCASTHLSTSYSTINDVALTECGINALTAVGSTFREVVIAGGQCGPIQIADSILAESGVQRGAVPLLYASNVRFEKCIAEGVEISRVELDQCQVKGGTIATVKIDHLVCRNGSDVSDTTIKVFEVKLMEAAGLRVNGIDGTHLNVDELRAKDSRWTGGTIRDVGLVRADFDDARFKSVNLLHVKVAVGTARNVQVDDCRIEQTDFDSVIFNKARFGRVTFIGARFNKSALDGARFSQCDLTSTAITDADLTSVDFVACTWERCNLSRSRVKRAMFKQANGLILTDAHIDGASFDESNVSGISAANATLIDATFRKSVVTRANFAGANLNRAVMTDAVFDSCDFSGADMTNARVTNSDFKSCTHDFHTKLPLGMTTAQKAGFVFREVDVTSPKSDG